MSESKVVRYTPVIEDGIVINGREQRSILMKKDDNGPVVTHADYKALEEEKEDWKRECKALREAYMQRSRDVAEARKELASLKARVRELVEAMDDTQGLLASMLHEPRCESEIEQQMVDNRVALEALK